MSYTGRATSSCAQASTLTLANNQLWMTYLNGTVAQFSATTGDTYDYFAPSTTPGDITTTFSLSNTGTLLWTSTEFFNGNALFCLLPSGVIIAVFQQGAQPISCVFIDLTIAERMWLILLQTDGSWPLTDNKTSYLLRCNFNWKCGQRCARRPRTIRVTTNASH